MSTLKEYIASVTQFIKGSKHLVSPTYNQGEVITLICKHMYDARNSNYLEMNLREKAEFDSKWFIENLKDYYITE